MAHLGQLDVSLGYSRQCFAMCIPLDCFHFKTCLNFVILLAILSTTSQLAARVLFGMILCKLSNHLLCGDEVLVVSDKVVWANTNSFAKFKKVVEELDYREDAITKSGAEGGFVTWGWS
jgi:hypothetical protein